MIIPETGQFIAFGDEDYSPEVHPSARTANLPNQREKGERGRSSSRLPKHQTPEPTKPIAQKIPMKKTTRED